MCGRHSPQPLRSGTSCLPRPRGLRTPQGRGSGGARRDVRRRGWGTRPRPYSLKPSPLAKPAARVRERGELSRRETPGRTLRKAPGRGWGTEASPASSRSLQIPGFAQKLGCSTPTGDPGSPAVLQLGSGGKSLASSPRGTLRSSLPPAGFCPPSPHPAPPPQVAQAPLEDTRGARSGFSAGPRLPAL